MRNLKFGIFENSGMPRESRILLFYTFETADNLTRSGILHYHVVEGRFMGPHNERELTKAALAFLSDSGRLPHTQPSPAL